MTTDALGIGFIGAGWMGRAHAHVLHTISHIAPLAQRLRLVAVAGRSPERVERVARDFGFERWTTRWEEVIEDPAVDVVANLAPNQLHTAPSIAALELGKPVLCEKPLGRNASEAREMLAAAEATGVTHCCGFNYRPLSASHAASSPPGSSVRFATFGRSTYRTGPAPRAGPATGASGRPRTEAARSATTRTSPISCGISVGSPRASARTPRSSVLVTQPEHPFLERWWAPGHILGWEHTFAPQWLEFLSAVLDDRPVSGDQASFEDGYRAAVVCDAVLASAQEGRRVRVADVEAAVHQ